MSAGLLQITLVTLVLVLRLRLSPLDAPRTPVIPLLLASFQSHILYNVIRFPMVENIFQVPHTRSCNSATTACACNQVRILGTPNHHFAAEIGAPAVFSRKLAVLLPVLSGQWPCVRLTKSSYISEMSTILNIQLQKGSFLRARSKAECRSRRR